MLQLIHVFKAAKFEITYASTALKSEHAFDLHDLGIDTTSIELNKASFDVFLEELQPSIVIFDRFIMEEQFGWRVAELLPNTLRILDTEDLHCLRKTRGLALKESRTFRENDLLNSEIAKREIASILRCDLSLIISSFEMNLLQNLFKIDKEILYYIPFLLDSITENSIKEALDFEDKNHFYFIGNFLHQPNYDAVLYLKTEIWPIISKQLPKVELHIYGAYPSQKVLQLNNTKERFIIKGKLANTNTLKQYKVCLAPLRFGAGIKGKLIEAMQFGIPSVTTSIGAESMHDNLGWNGFIENSPSKIAAKSIVLYSQKEIWQKAQLNGYEIINKLYNKDLYADTFINQIKQIQKNLNKHRSTNFIGELLQYHTLKSSKYLSKWIEEKNN